MARTLDSLEAQFVPTNGQLGFRQRLKLGITVMKYLIRLTGTFTVGTNAVIVLEDSPYGYFRNLQLVLGGSFPLRSHDARAGRFLNRMQHGTDNLFVAPNAAAAAVTSVAAELTLDLEQPDLLPPLDRAFWLDSRRVANLEMVFDFGNQDDITTPNSGGTANTFTVPQVTISSKQVQDEGGPLSRMQIAKIAQQAITAVGDQPDVLITALGPAYRGLLFHFVSQAASPSGVTDPLRESSDDSIPNTFTIITDNIRYLDQRPYLSLRQEMKQNYMFENLPPGWALVDFARSHIVRDVLQTGNRRTVAVRVNAAAAPTGATMFVYPMNSIILTSAGAVVLPQGVAQRAPAAAAARR